MSYSLQNIIANYELLSNDDPQVRQSANIHLMGLIYHEEAWTVTEQMITQSTNQNYQLLGAQILHQKLEKQATAIPKEVLRELKQFIFAQLAAHMSVPTLRKLASAAAVVAVVTCLQDWPTIVNDMVNFMKVSAGQLQSGLITLGAIAEELSKSNSVRQGVKIQVKQKILEQEGLIAEVFMSALTISHALTGFALQALENWVGIGFPLLKYKQIVGVLLMLMEQQHDLFFEPCCKILSEGVKITAQLKFHTLTTVDFNIEMQRYSEQEVESLKLLIQYLRNTKGQLLAAVKGTQGLESILIYTGIVKQLLLSFGFLLLDNIGFELLQIMVSTLQCRNLKVSYSTFQFWLDFCEKMSKYKMDAQLDERIWTVTQYLLTVLLNKATVQNEGGLLELAREEDTLDDIDDVSFAEYRKEAQYVIKTLYEYFTKKREKEGSSLFFKKLLQRTQRDTLYPAAGTELSIYAVKSSLESMVKEYDTSNLVQFLQFLVGRTEGVAQIPPRVTAQILGLIKDCNRQIKQREQLFMKCLSFSLKFVQDEALCHYAVYAFQSLMESLQNLSSAALVNDLLTFYESKTFSKQTILEKVLDGVLTSITKLQDRAIIGEYFSRIMNAMLARNNQLLQRGFEADAYFLPLIEVKTILDSFDHFRPPQKQFFRDIFLGIADQGISIVTRIVANYLQHRLKYSNVNQLGLSLAVCRNALKLCEGLPPERVPIGGYINLMNLILEIFKQNDMAFFMNYSSLLEIICKVLIQFMSTPIPALNSWLEANLFPIDHFFLGYVQTKSLNQLDPDVIKEFFSIQESVIIYSQQIFLAQPQLQDILELSLPCLQFLNEKQMQRKVVYFLYLCVQIRTVFACKFDRIARALFAAVPILNNICYINVGRIFTAVFQGIDVKKKECVFRELLQYEPYCDVERDLKEIMAKFVAFAVESKVERFIKGVLNDLTDIKWKKSGSDLALHLEMRFSNWKRQYSKMLKNGELAK